jgi:hypothetical protein
MLDEGDQRLLAEIESSLRAHDPRFVNRFERRCRLSRRDLVALAVLLPILAFAVLALVSHNIAGTVLAVTAVGGTVGTWLTRRLDKRRVS